MRRTSSRSTAQTLPSARRAQPIYDQNIRSTMDANAIVSSSITAAVDIMGRISLQPLLMFTFQITRLHINFNGRCSHIGLTGQNVEHHICRILMHLPAPLPFLQSKPRGVSRTAVTSNGISARLATPAKKRPRLKLGIRRFC